MQHDLRLSAITE